jgi:hypothetical protein
MERFSNEETETAIKTFTIPSHQGNEHQAQRFHCASVQMTIMKKMSNNKH